MRHEFFIADLLAIILTKFRLILLEFLKVGLLLIANFFHCWFLRKINHVKIYLPKSHWFLD